MRSGPHGDEVAATFGKYLLDRWDCQIASYDPAVEEETIAESKLANAYTELLSSARFDFQGETLNLSQLSKYTQHADRAVRHEAAQQVRARARGMRRGQ